MLNLGRKISKIILGRTPTTPLHHAMWRNSAKHGPGKLF